MILGKLRSPCRVRYPQRVGVLSENPPDPGQQHDTLNGWLNAEMSIRWLEPLPGKSLDCCAPLLRKGMGRSLNRVIMWHLNV